MVEWVPVVVRPYKPLHISMCYTGYRNTRAWKSIIGYSYSLPCLAVSEGLWIYPKEYMHDFQEEFITKLMDNENLFKEIKKATLEQEKGLVESKSLTEFFTNFSNYIPALGIYFMTDKLEKFIRNNVSSDIVELVLFPSQFNYYVQERLDLIKAEDIEAHVKKYKWILSRYGKRKEYTFAAAMKKREELIAQKYEKKTFEEQQKKQEATSKAKKELKENAFLLDILQFFIYYRTHRSDVMNRMLFEFIPAIEEFAKKKGLTYEEAVYCTVDELLGEIPSKNIREDRMRECTFLGLGDVVRILVGSEHKKFFAQFDLKSKTTEVSGLVAYPGIVRGIVRVVKNSGDINKVKKGDVIVAIMTTPDIVPAMERAAAFVTDEGGITCHASIMSREMKKACVIGTTVATRVFKDGDLVEVDANNGVVRKV